MNKATIDTDRSPLWLEIVVLIAATLAATVTEYVALALGCSGLTAPRSATPPPAPTLTAFVP